MSDRLTERAFLAGFHARPTPTQTGWEFEPNGVNMQANGRQAFQQWLAKVTPQPCAGCAALREALVKVRAHTGFRPDATLQLLVALLASIERITDSALAPSQPDWEKP
jgi:hypothetical protein